MKFWILAFALFNGASAFAQRIPRDCQFQVNPHSYSCTRWTFDGNQMFPLLPMDWNGVVQGTWQPITFTDPVTGNTSADFSMQVNPQRPTIPEGVVDNVTGQMLAPITIRGDQVFFANWHGTQFWSIPGTTQIPDRVTARFQFADNFAQHSFNCRDFNRNATHHLLCAWDVWNDRAQTWQHRGFLGFLKTGP